MKFQVKKGLNLGLDNTNPPLFLPRLRFMAPCIWWDIKDIQTIKTMMMMTMMMMVMMMMMMIIIIITYIVSYVSVLMFKCASYNMCTLK